MKYAHDRILQKALPLKLNETMNALTFVSSFLNIIQLGVLNFFFYYTGLCPGRWMKEANTDWLKWISRKHLQASVFSFLVLNLVEKVVLHYAGLYKSALRN